MSEGLNLVAADDVSELDSTLVFRWPLSYWQPLALLMLVVEVKISPELTEYEICIITTVTWYSHKQFVEGQEAV